MYLPLRSLIVLSILYSFSVNAEVTFIRPGTPQVVGVAPPHNGDFTDISPDPVFDSSFRLDLYCAQNFPGSFACSEKYGFGKDLMPGIPSWFEESNLFSQREMYASSTGVDGHWFSREYGNLCSTSSNGPWSSSSQDTLGWVRVPGLADAEVKQASCNKVKPVACCQIQPVPEPGMFIGLFSGFLFFICLGKLKKG